MTLVIFECALRDSTISIPCFVVRKGYLELFATSARSRRCNRHGCSWEHSKARTGVFIRIMLFAIQNLQLQFSVVIELQPGWVQFGFSSAVFLQRFSWDMSGKSDWDEKIYSVWFSVVGLVGKSLLSLERTRWTTSPFCLNYSRRQVVVIFRAFHVLLLFVLKEKWIQPRLLSQRILALCMPDLGRWTLVTVPAVVVSSLFFLSLVLPYRRNGFSEFEPQRVVKKSRMKECVVLCTIISIFLLRATVRLHQRELAKVVGGFEYLTLAIAFSLSDFSRTSDLSCFTQTR